ncbi:MAG TPA: magnesium-translocating P-type ATPase [Anaerolineae bacterium]
MVKHMVAGRSAEGEQNSAVRPAVEKLYWHASIDELFAALDSNADGLTAAGAAESLAQHGRNELGQKHTDTWLGLFLSQFKSPLMLLLLGATAVSALLQDWTDALIIMIIVVGSTLLSTAQEYRASAAVEALRSRIAAKARVLRDGTPQEIPAAEVVPGDVVLLSAGSLIPADGVLIDAKDLYVSQSALTGESFPVIKEPGATAADASLAERTNCVYLGTNVRSGTARALMVETGARTAFGQVAQRLTLRPPETEFESGLRHFGSMVTQVALAMMLAVFAVNVLLHKPPVDSLLFSISLAVGMAPEMLPAILTITLSRGAVAMSRRGVIVRRLSAIENFGSMDVLCTDKTGTLTEGTVRLDRAVDAAGQPSAEVLRYAYLNAHLQTGLSNPLDEAIAASVPAGTVEEAQKVDEVPYDFVRKRLSVVVEDGAGYAGASDDGASNTGRDLLITKGAFDNVLAACCHVRQDGVPVALDDAGRDEIQQRYATWSSQGLRVLGVATKALPAPRSAGQHWTAADECDMTFEGCLLFLDRPKASAASSIANLARLGVHLKIITGDNRLVARQTAQAVQMPVASVITGAELNGMSDEALWQRAEQADIFAEVDPSQKERIILALKKKGHVVGYMGDGINDASALHAADVGVSVDSAVDVARQAADLVLLQQDLGVLAEGIELGRKSFVNTIKYIFTSSSGNFGNMFSMAGTSLFLPFLPMLPKQILFQNLLSDVPAMTIGTDNVDPELVEQPRRWNMRFIRNFMVVFGLTSSIFDYLTFGVLLFVVHAAPDQFRTAWFLESLLTELCVTLVVRTWRPFYRSRPGRWLVLATAAVAGVAVLVLNSPLGALLGFTPLPGSLILLILGITALYILATEVAKRGFYRRVHV